METAKQILSISTVAFDGYPLPLAFEQIARIGARYVEIAYIEGYIDPFTEEVFTKARARTLLKNLIDAGLSCHAFSAHLDLSAAGVVEIFQRRMEFARELGAAVVISNAAPPSREHQFLANVERIAARAKDLGLTIALENPGDGRENLLDTGVEGARLIERLGLPNVGLNYDFGNVISHMQERVRPEDDFKEALSHTVHLHIKDVAADGRGWYFTEIGKGSVDYRSILSEPRVRKLPVSLEIPLRLRRLPSGSPRRGADPVAVERILEVLAGSFEFTKRMLAG
ncbi:MAG: sugar phosphate isomerase/epimerase [Spirochaetales bacterium]|nr:sugar phosphate isomerase/epimerase [Spirochaetales bacterium]